MAKRDNEGMRASSILPALIKADPIIPHTANQNEKRKYAQRFSDALAVLVANEIRGRHKRFETIRPGPRGDGRESRAKTKKGFKKLDVNYSTLELGLALGVSIKTVNHKDLKRTKSGEIKSISRYDHNLSRHDTEFLAESSAYHQRQPYAVMVALFFLPADGCDDGTARRASSFGRAVEWFHHRAGRERPDEDPNLFERIFVGIYEPEGTARGDVRFFDVMTAPPWNGRPPDRDLLTFDKMIDAIISTYERRNGMTFEWSTGEISDEDEPDDASDDGGIDE